MGEQPRVAEFFAGIGLMRAGVEAAGLSVAWANDIDVRKHEMYTTNFGSSEYVLGDVRDVTGEEIPDVQLATASFPCTDLSLAGNRLGLGRWDQSHPRGDGSSMFWEFARVIGEMGTRRPPVALLENVVGFASSAGGRDLADAVGTLNELGYSCDVFTIDARHFVPQSRPRLFIVGIDSPRTHEQVHCLSDAPGLLASLLAHRPSLRLHRRALPTPPGGPSDLNGIVEPDDSPAIEWWDKARVDRFVGSLSALNEQRLDELTALPVLALRTAYRRTRGGRAVWEIRSDGIAGCLRTPRGGSSKQALVETGRGELRIRWMTPREYARLMGAPRFILSSRESNALFGFGDAVCVPVIRWLCEHYLASAIQNARPMTAIAA